MDKLTIISEHINHITGKTEDKTTFIKEGDLRTLPKFLEAIEDALRASGFIFKGYLTIVEDEE